MNIKDFSGGLALRPYDADIKMLYGRRYIDIDHQRGSLIPIRTPLSILAYDYICESDNHIVGETIPENTRSWVEKERIAYHLKWKPFVETDLNGTNEVSKGHIKDTDPIPTGGRMRFYIYRVKDDKGNKTKFSSYLNVVVRDETSTVTIGQMGINKELYDKGFKTLEIFLAKDAMYGDSAEITRTFTKVGETNTLHLDDGYYYGEFTDDNTSTQVTEEVNLADLLDTHKQFYNQKVIDMRADQMCEGGQYTIEAHTSHKFIHATNIDGQWIVAPSYTFITNEEDEDSNCFKPHFFGLKHYYSRPITIFIWYGDGWKLLKTLPHPQAEYIKEDALDTSMTTQYLTPPVRTSLITIDKEVEDVIDEATGSYDNSYICDSINTLRGAFTFSNLLDTFIPHTKEGSVIDYKGKTYLFEPDKSFFTRPDQTGWADMDLPAPTVTHTTEDIGEETDNYKVKYRYTYYNSVYGYESIPTETDEIELHNSIVKVKFTVNNIPNITADRVRVYRLAKGLINYTLAIEIPLNGGNSEYYDIVKSDDLDDIAGNDVLLSVTESSIPKGIHYVTATNTILVGAVKDKVYFSLMGKPTMWLKDNYIDFDTDVTGIGAINNGLIVFTLNETYIIVGNSPTTFAKYLVSKEVGCIDGNTIKPFNNGLVFTSYDGIYFTNGGSISNITTDPLGDLDITPDIIVNAEAVNDQYHLALKTDDIFKSEYYEPLNEPMILVIDYRYNKMIRQVNQDVSWLSSKHRDYMFIDSKEDFIYKLYPKDTPYKTMRYRSGIVTNGRFTELKMYNDVYIAYEDDIHIKIDLLTKKKDTITTIADKNLNNLDRHIDLNTRGFIEGYGIIIDVIGKGKVHEIDFLPYNRQNGK